MSFFTYLSDSIWLVKWPQRIKPEKMYVQWDLWYLNKTFGIFDFVCSISRPFILSQSDERKVRRTYAACGAEGVAQWKQVFLFEQWALHNPSIKKPLCQNFFKGQTGLTTQTGLRSQSCGEVSEMKMPLQTIYRPAEFTCRTRKGAFGAVKCHINLSAG